MADAELERLVLALLHSDTGRIHRFERDSWEGCREGDEDRFWKIVDAETGSTVVGYFGQRESVLRELLRSRMSLRGMDSVEELRLFLESAGIEDSEKTGPGVRPGPFQQQ